MCLEVVCVSAWTAGVHRFLFSALCSLPFFLEVTGSREQFVIHSVYSAISYVAYYLLLEVSLMYRKLLDIFVYYKYIGTQKLLLCL